MMARSRDWHISGWAALLLAPLAFPIAVLIQLLPSRRARDRSAKDVVRFLRDFAHGAGGKWDWDDFTSVPISDPRLDVIRKQAELIQLPINPEGREQLNKLLGKPRRWLHLARALLLTIPRRHDMLPR